MNLEISLAYEMKELIKDGWSQEEARSFILDLLRTEYKTQVMAEVDEDICYTFKDVVSDIIASVESLLNRMTYIISAC